MDGIAELFKRKITAVMPETITPREFNQALNCKVRFTKREAKQILGELRDDGLINIRRKRGFFIEKV
jgi:hypothetical protein